jgi:sugar/nucleoside kinase (ribokinase family)
LTVDVVCAGAPFLDLVLRGLDRSPAAGEEVLAQDLVIVPGAMANVAFALRQLELEPVFCAPRGTDPAGRFLKQLMDDAGIPWIGEPTTATPVSVGLPLDGERAFVTVHPTAAVDVDAIARARPRAVVVNLPLPTGLRDGLPDQPHLYGVVGDPQVTILLNRPVEEWAGLRAAFLNEREAFHLSGRSDAADAARLLAERGCLVVVTRAVRGAVAACPDGRVAETPGLPVVALDTVGAGDLFTAAFIWADLAGRSLEESLDVSIAYASHSLAAPGLRQKGLSRAAFLDATRPTPNGSWMLEVRG